MTIAALVARKPLRLGAINETVRLAQYALRREGYELNPDAEFGRITQTAVKTFQACYGLPLTGEVDVRTAELLDKIPAAPAPSALNVSPWLATMRAITGTKEVPGNKDNPFIIEMAHEIVRRYPELRGNVGWYNHDGIPWCGLGMGYVFAINGIKPVSAPLSAIAWAEFGVALKVGTPGAVLVKKRKGGGHVTLYESEDAKYYYGRGGNQSDSVNVSKILKSEVIAIRWPAGVALPTAGRKLGVTSGAVLAGSEA